MSPVFTTRVKICGLTREADARIAEESGASFLGVILAGGPRLVTVEQARSILGPPRSGIKRAAVFGNQSVDEIERIADELSLDVLQIHGNPAWQTGAGGSLTGPDKHSASAAQLRLEAIAEVFRRASAVGRAVWPVQRVSGSTLPAEALALAKLGTALLIDTLLPAQPGVASSGMSDTTSSGMPDGVSGGTGIPLNWEGLRAELAALRSHVPGLCLILAGGLRPSNVQRAVGLLEPSVVDVSSGVESAPGVKDPERIRQFLRSVSGAVEKADGSR